MSDERAGLVEAPRGERRVLGRVSGTPGPTMVVLAGIHGNEPAGVSAAQRVLARLVADRPPLAGSVVFLAGNLVALERRMRFVDVDLNRQWTPERVASALGAGGRPGGEPVEIVEQRELLATLSGILREARGEVHYFVDLHTSSADGPPFLTVGDTLRNRRFARQIPLPLILGLEEQVDGALLEYLNNLGVITLGVEAGRSEDPASVDHHESVLWLAICAAGMLDRRAVPDAARHRARLERASRGTPRVIEVRHRHAITPADGFRMEPGMRNFDRVERGQLLARDGVGPIHAHEAGLVLLPLYQGQGEDGFFLSREVRGSWLRVSALLRRLRLPALMSLLPGVRRHPCEADVLVVDTRVARFYPIEIFHLFGFRKLRAEGQELVVSRRRHDFAAPARICLP
jgi:succinylglutamate desuccinylase